jgi:hypothetical protein
MELFKIDNPRLSLILSPRDLDDRERRQQLRAKLDKDDAFRLELLCRDNPRAFERLAKVCKAHGVRLVVDPFAQARLNNKRLKTNYVLYAEDLTPAELTDLLAQLGREDKGSGLFDSLLVNAMTAAHRQELSKLLGVDLKQLQLQSSRGKAPLGVDIRKPVSAGTADQVAAALAGQGTSRPDPARPSAKGPERTALVLAYNPAPPRSGPSREVKQFLDGRKERRPGTVQLVLVLREVKA